ncbi:MAG: hypothetical protein A2539_02735 [Elusimicrobia bacterium RIFOXYD2_FULL_34_15]|nr:MAG: hypothetical protein A2539_02735 [Elusimicrobia bacterium RIFOXYD2_FULL_34_15]
MSIKKLPSEQENLLHTNSEQKIAITHTRGPLLIVAGAGTGKTTVIAHRIANLISQKKAKPDEILALTFTEKAAAEMQERVDLLVPYGFADVWISTFHSFGNRILEDESIYLGLTSDFRVMAQPQQIVFFKEHLFEFPMDKLRPLGNPLKHIESILFLFSRLKDEDVSSEDYNNYIKLFENVVKENPKDVQLKDGYLIQKELSEIYKKYEDLKMQYGLIDFSDQVWLVLKLFREHPSVLKRYRDKFKYILVDEFQDTNYSQFQLLKILLNKEKNITVVGDDDQSIYKFRGAAISNIINFKNTYPSAKQVVLNKNYRSNQSILDFAYNLIKFNNPDRLEVKNKINKKLISVRTKEQKNKRTKEPVSRVFNNHFDTVSAEADFVAEKIQKLSKEGKGYRDFAVLVRSNNDSNPIIKSLNVRNIPWHFSGSSGLYAREEVKILISFLKVISDLSDNISLFHLASSDIYNMPMEDLTICLNEASKSKTPIYKIFNNSNLDGISDSGKDVIKKIIEDIKKFINASKELSTGQILYKFIHDTGWIKKIVDKKDGQSIEKVSNVALFFEIVRNFAEISKNDKVQFFISHLASLIEAGSDPATSEADLDTDAVNILTIHKAKGLEFSVVFMVSLVQGKFPVNRRKEALEVPDSLVKDILPSGDFHKQEERRLFYVGMTRAKDELYLTSAADYGGQRERKVSQFVFEALNLAQTKIVMKKLNPLEAIKMNEVINNTKSNYLQVKKQLSMSHFQIDDYLTCPLKYKYIHLLRIPVMANHAIVYGNAIHETIQFYYKKKIDKKTVLLDELIKKFESHWESIGFLSVEHEEQRLEEGREALRKFFHREEKAKIIPKYIEKKFKINYGDDVIIGRFDRVDFDGEDAIIVDFKTSDVSEQKEADERAKESTQLAIYSLAWAKLTGKLPKSVELHFVNTGVVGSVQPDEKMIEKIEKIIEDVALGIKNRQFDANPGYMSCNYCPFNNICQSVKISR